MSYEDLKFWSRVSKFGECLVWGGPVNEKGYGRLWFNGEHTKAHRLSYTLTIGRIPLGLEVHHTCKNRRCVNPLHLVAVTHAENCSPENIDSVLRNKKFCKYGHEFTPENTYLKPSSSNGVRDCKQCMGRRSQEWKAKWKILSSVY